MLLFNPSLKTEGENGMPAVQQCKQLEQYKNSINICNFHMNENYSRHLHFSVWWKTKSLVFLHSFSYLYIDSWHTRSIVSGTVGTAVVVSKLRTIQNVSQEENYT